MLYYFLLFCFLIVITVNGRNQVEGLGPALAFKDVSKEKEEFVKNFSRSFPKDCYNDPSEGYSSCLPTLKIQLPEEECGPICDSVRRFCRCLSHNIHKANQFNHTSCTRLFDRTCTYSSDEIHDGHKHEDLEGNVEFNVTVNPFKFASPYWIVLPSVLIPFLLLTLVVGFVLGWVCKGRKVKKISVSGKKPRDEW